MKEFAKPVQLIISLLMYLLKCQKSSFPILTFASDFSNLPETLTSLWKEHMTSIADAIGSTFTHLAP